ncbi:hypothetical protein [Kitasatospora viridis]|uniref:Uncharacterized protein n=1 Tax=Kitasatospora viridis TaxID=281105 RepID=A0A561UQC3_9ACTN|nr:hypothetical protein [Kitasatospora viridis]TWG01573.1 hypothetical protein FHX73_115474 [Kitasatospora viridis]
MIHRSTSRSRALPGHGFGRGAAAVLLLALAGLTTACGGQNTPQPLGALPIPSAPLSPAPVTASPGHAQLVAMGDPVQLVLAGAHGQVTASGPDLEVSGPAPDGKVASESKGSVTVVLRATDGSARLDPADLAATDEQGKPIPLTADAGPLTATPGHDATLHLSGTFPIGHATLQWNQSGQPLATWDFEVELD